MSLELTPRTDKLVPCLLVKNDENWLPYVLRSVQGRFSRFVIYDVGSEDSTRDIIEAFIYAEKAECDITYRPLPHCSPTVQGTFRNAMIAEARSDWYLILDADEVYRKTALDDMIATMPTMQELHERLGKIYGVVRRFEVNQDLTQIHGLDEFVKHHRVYHRTAIWTGTHPGEAPVVPQKAHREEFFPKAVGCYHFHQPRRSRLDQEVPSREKRRWQNTYLRGNAKDVDIFEHIPLLTERLNQYENTYLTRMRYERTS